MEKTARPSVRLELREGILELVLNRPPWNILDRGMCRELVDLLRAPVDSSARALLVRGEGKGFCAGVSVEDHLPDRAGEMLTVFGQVIRHLHRFPLPTLSVVHGAALGGGLELACATDLLMAAGDAKLGQPEVRLATLAPAALIFLPRRVGYHRAADLLFSGRTVRAEEGIGWGLVDFVVPGESLLEEARRYLSRLVSLSRPVLTLYKEALRAVNDPLRALGQAEDLYREKLLPLADYEEGLRAFLQKREPQWEEGRPCRA